MGSCKFILFCMTAAGTLIAQMDSTVFSSLPVRSMYVFLKKHDKRMSDILSEKEILQKNYDSLVAKTVRYKQDSQIDFWGRLDLKSLLTQSEALAKEINALDDEGDSLAGKISTLRDSLSHAMREEISDDLKNSNKTISQKINEKLNCDLNRIPTKPVQTGRVRFLINEDNESLDAKSDYMIDQHDKLIRYNNQLETVAREWEWSCDLDRTQYSRKPVFRSVITFSLSGLLLKEGMTWSECIAVLKEERTATIAQAKRYTAIANEILRISGNKK